jgi:hypothetical protein
MLLGNHIVFVTTDCFAFAMVENRLGLNNLLQQRYGTSVATHLRWESVKNGTDHNPTWTFIVYSTCSFFDLVFLTFFGLVDDIEYGRGSGSDKGSAKERAAGVALMQLQRQWAHLLP